MGDWTQQGAMDLKELQSDFNCALRRRLKTDMHPFFDEFVDELIDIVRDRMSRSESHFETGMVDSTPSTSIAMASCRRRKLVFRHTCSVDACSDEKCALCKNALMRPCLPDNIFQNKYIREKEPILAKCGGAIYIELVDESTGQILKENMNLRLHFITPTVLRNRRTTESVECIESAVFSHLVNNQLAETDTAIECGGRMIPEEGLQLDMKDGIAIVPADIKVKVSADLHMVAVPEVNTSQSTLAAVSPDLCFISRRAGGDKRRSKEHPHVGDEISALNDVGEKTAEKFKLRNIVTVGDFKHFLENESQPDIAELGKYVKGASPEGGAWSKICESARSAVDFDDLYRVWRHRGRCIFFACLNGQIQWSGHTVNMLESSGECRSGIYCVHDKNEHIWLVEEAKKDWNKPEHGNCWSIADDMFDGNDFTSSEEVTPELVPQIVDNEASCSAMRMESAFYTAAPPEEVMARNKQHMALTLNDYDKMSISLESVGTSGDFVLPPRGPTATSLDIFRQTSRPGNSPIGSLEFANAVREGFQQDAPRNDFPSSGIWVTLEGTSRGFPSIDENMNVH